ncbi:thiamine diphosphokinase [Gemella sp. zg-570]|uniref:thiamine diphosphokinase n=1 Tax=Gemella sp. zg-570 TaxID=2840371 RepID=UPI00209ADDBD|nr:thiamine diphosphokinase [Gemella sp. zg-570]
MNMNEILEINVMLGGLKPTFLHKKNIWVGVDSGAEFLIDNNIQPILICGDLDSFDYATYKKILKNTRIIKKENQDLTDAEFSLDVIIKNFSNVKKINIFGATGKRLDHFFGNILLLNNLKYEHLEITLYDNNNIIFVSKLGVNKLTNNKEYKYISFVPIFENTVISIHNAKYSVENFKLTLDRANATSNEFFEDSNIILNTNKKCLIIYSKD